MSGYKNRTIVFTSFENLPELSKTGRYSVFNIDGLQKPENVDFTDYDPLKPPKGLYENWNRDREEASRVASNHAVSDSRVVAIAKSLADATYCTRYREDVRDVLDPEAVVHDLFEIAGDKIPVVTSSEPSTVISHRRLVWDWFDKSEAVRRFCDVEEFSGVEDRQEEKNMEDMVKRQAVKTLEEFNRYRRGEGEYMWNEDPLKNKPLTLSPRVIGEAIDYAVKYMREH